MAFRRGFSRPDERVQQFRSSGQWPRDVGPGDQSDRYRPRVARRGFGWARRRDIEDTTNQGAAPRRGGRYDPTGEERYARGFDSFERGSEPDQLHALGRDAGGYAGSSPARWELDEGGVQFGGRPRAEQMGPYRGRGPRGYQRSDDRIREDVCECLTIAHDVDAGDIEVRVEDGLVVLTGTVEDRYAKRRSEDIAESVTGVRDVQNQLRVQPPGDRARSGV